SGRRLVINSGTSEYRTGPERQRQRGTPAHTTVSIDGQDSSEVWGGFRVARRARPFGLAVSHADARVEVACAHDGYRRLAGSPVHRRRWVLDAAGLDVHDEVPGAPGRACIHLHWAPDIRCTAGGDVVSCGTMVARVAVDGASWRSAASSWHPGFGRVVSNESLLAPVPGTACTLRLRWT
ncbi:MAG: heparinase II/III-family protein, partial [Phycisphaerales bacterium]